MENETINQKSNLKIFLISGGITLLLYALYVLLIVIFVKQLNLLAIIFFYIPLLPYTLILNLLHITNPAILIIFSIVGNFCFGGLFGLFISKLIRKWTK